ncbi:MAG: hypothetical protein IKB64_02040 [Paludibacteraceae bacterium]|nr:hypothetical protein [Paludibacteraceae bacterium]
MIDKEHVTQEIEYLRSRIEDTTEAIDEHKKRLIKLKQQKTKLRKELLEKQQLLWRCGGEE